MFSILLVAGCWNMYSERRDERNVRQKWNLAWRGMTNIMMCTDVVQMFRNRMQFSRDELPFLPEIFRMQMKYCNIFFGKETGA